MIFMNEMYELSQSIHIYSVIALIVVLLLMIAMHKVKGDFEKFVKNIKIAMVFHLSLLGFVVLTGTVMMAAKHLSFSPANLLMIVSVFVVITLEIKRNKALVKVIKFKMMREESYKRLGFRYQSIELFLLLGVSAFAGMASAVSF
jgi:hypothetical protein